MDLLVGTNVDDWRVFMAFIGDVERVTDEALAGPVDVHGHFAVASYGLPVEKALAAYRERYPGASPGDLLSAVKTDWWVRIPALRLADAHAEAPAATYMYEFAWAVPGLGAVHALEVPFIFDQLRKDVPIFQLLFMGTEAPQVLADTMHGAWVSFAANGNPGLMLVNHRLAQGGPGEARVRRTKRCDGGRGWRWCAACPPLVAAVGCHSGGVQWGFAR